MLNDWVGWLLIFLSFFIVIKFKERLKDGRLALMVSFMLAMHHIVALINAYICTVKGAEADAAGFHRLGVEWAMGGVNSH